MRSSGERGGRKKEVSSPVATGPASGVMSRAVGTKCGSLMVLCSPRPTVAGAIRRAEEPLTVAGMEEEKEEENVRVRTFL